MPANPLKGFLRSLRLPVLLRAGDQADAYLLSLFVEQRDETAFEAFLRLHGRMVHGVCQRVLRNYHDIEDAVQATFLVLACKAASIKKRNEVGNWLYGVAYRTSLKVRAAADRRRAREKQVAVMPEPVMEKPDDPWQELIPYLDQELERLPDKYRTAIVLCDLEGRTHQEAARRLGWPVGTLSSRLVRGRALLAKRLTKRGVTLPAAALAALLTAKGAPAGVQAVLVAQTVKAAGLIAAGQTATSVVSAPVLALVEGVVKAMLLNKLKVTGVVVLLATFAVSGAGVLTRTAWSANQVSPHEETKEQGGTSIPVQRPIVSLGDIKKGLTAAESRLQSFSVTSHIKS
jgi:RNA polymerase sigma-70 factor (ECF subfamily)